MVRNKQNRPHRAEPKEKEKKKMMNMIKRNPVAVAVFYFVFTWVWFPITALLISQLRDISFVEAINLPHMIAIFSAGSVISAVQMFRKAKNVTR